VDFAAAMRRMRERRAQIARHDSAERIRQAGVDLFFGAARFADPRTVLVDGQRLRFSRAIVATGVRPSIPPIAGLDAVPFLTSETVFSLTVAPTRLLVIGAGPIGCELAQAFARFGCTVTLFDQVARVLPRDDADAAAVVQRHLEGDDVRFELGVEIERIARAGSETVVRYRRGGASAEATGDALLVAAGRRPNLDGLDLASAGIASTTDGLVVNDRLQSSNPRVFGAGDVCSPYQFTHAADALARIAVRNALFHGRRRASALVIPRVTYTDPEIAHVGASTADVAASGGRLQTITVALSEIDRAIVDDDEDGFVRVHHARSRVRGCTIVARSAGELIGEAVYVITHGGTLPALSATVHPYPTLSDAFRKAGDAYRRQSLTPPVRRWFERYFRWTSWR
jgi:pyruvate/2-oxoglutarate dehydrogenase complex dihydrolipoamide dehydrogenase (E3) component